MREILFRGKRIDNGEWVEGYYVSKFYRTDKELSDYITIPYPDEENRGSDHFIVIPETVGQYTGLCDKNGKKIFEGDIVRIEISCNGEKVTEITRVGYDYKFCGFFPMRWENSCDGCDCYFAIEEIEIIGNIHDNPELLKGGAEE